MLAETRKQLPEDLDILVLPVQEIGKANEHVYGPGTLSLGAELLIPVWTAIGQKVSEAGVRKMVIVNSHGGNTDIISIVSRELRVRYEMAVLVTHWGRFGHPDGMISAHESKFGIHGGEVETSLMLHFRPELVRMDKAENFISKAEEMLENSKYIQPTRPTPWPGSPMISTRPASLVMPPGNGGKGAVISAHQAAGFIEMLRDFTAYSLTNLYKP